MYNPTINQKKRETKTNFHQNGIKKKRGRPEEEKQRQETGLPVYPTRYTTGIVWKALPLARNVHMTPDRKTSSWWNGEATYPYLNPSKQTDTISGLGTFIPCM
jgi:hypothetical protein